MKGIAFLPLRPGLFTIVDADCPAWILEQKWSVQIKSEGHCYAYRTHRTLHRGNKQHQALHHAILDVEPNAGEVDHINGDALDNRRENLRFCKHAENGRNLKKWRSVTSSRYKGVSKRGLRWRAYIVLQGKQKHLGCFIHELDAAKAYDTKAKELFGKFARLNFTSRS